jgi:MFS family permease
MLHEGVYTNLCEGEFKQSNFTLLNATTQAKVLCVEQEERLDQMFAITAGVIGIMAYVVGVLLDIIKRRAVFIISGIVFGAGSIMFGYSNSVTFDAYLPSFILIATAGMAIYYASLTYSREVPASGFVIGLLSAAWDVSAIVPYFFQLLHFHTGASIKALFFSFASTSIPIIIFGFFMDTPNSKPKEEDSVVHQLKDKSAKEKAKTILSYLIPYKELTYPAVWVAFTFTAFGSMFQDFYMQTLRAQLGWFSKYDSATVEKQMYLFSILLPALGPIAAIASGKAKDMMGLLKSFSLMAPCILAMLIAVIFRNADLQNFTMVVFIIFRGMFWVVATAFFFDDGHYSIQAAAKLRATLALLGGILGTFVNPPLETLALNQLHGNFFIINISILSFLIVSIIATVIAIYLRDKYKLRVEDEERTRLLATSVPDDRIL